MSTTSGFLRQKWRFAAFALNSAIFYGAYVGVTGHWYLTGGGETLWLLSALGLWGLGLISAPWYRPPRDALGAALGVLLALFTLDLSTATNLQHVVVPATSIVIVYGILVAGLAGLAGALERGGRFERWRALFFSITSLLARGELLFGATAYSQDHVKAIPNLRFLEFIAYGKAVRSERPLIVRRPFDEAKLLASQSLDAPRPTATKGDEPTEQPIIDQRMD